ncbi:MAG: integration host factor, actinobacterial type [Clostridiales bacterium]
MAIPTLTLTQRAEALNKAREMRSKRTALRKELKGGNLTIGEILETTDDEVVSRMKVKYLLESLPNVGKITANTLMEEIGIQDSRRVRGLGKHQKEMLLNILA